MGASTEQALARLKAAPWLQQPALKSVFAALDADKGLVRVVGGAVRDTLIGRNAALPEIDLATVLEPDEVVARARVRGISAIPTGIAFGTVTLAVDNMAFEVTTLRHDVETDGRRAVVRFGSDWIEDARRRDFTLNALYCGPHGSLFDPLGGLADCLAGRVRFIGDAGERIAEDRLRVYRFFRFSASHGGEIFDADGLAASQAAADDLGPVSAERIGHEMTRILRLKRCARTLAVMTEAGIIETTPDRLDVLQRYEDVAEEPGLTGRLTLLAGADGLKVLQKRWRLSNAVIKHAEAAQKASALIAAGLLAEAAYRHGDFRHVATEIAAALQNWSAEQARATVARLDAYAPPVFPLTGAVLLQNGIAAGPKLGALLSRLEKRWIDSEFTLTREDLLALAHES